MVRGGGRFRLGARTKAPIGCIERVSSTITILPIGILALQHGNATLPRPEMLPLRLLPAKCRLGVRAFLPTIPVIDARRFAVAR